LLWKFSLKSAAWNKENFYVRTQSSWYINPCLSSVTDVTWYRLQQRQNQRKYHAVLEKDVSDREVGGLQLEIPGFSGLEVWQQLRKCCRQYAGETALMTDETDNVLYTLMPLTCVRRPEQNIGVIIECFLIRANLQKPTKLIHGSISQNKVVESCRGAGVDGHITMQSKLPTMTYFV
jgi:hypothetical protein